MKDWLIRKLGGFTLDDYETVMMALEMCCEFRDISVEKLDDGVIMVRDANGAVFMSEVA